MVVFLLFFRDVSRDTLLPIIKGILISTLGLVVFLVGVRFGFIPFAREMGVILARTQPPAVLILIGFAVGLTATIAEPAVKILASEVDRSSTGYLKERAVLWTIALGVASAVALHMLRVSYGFPLFYLIGPGYLLALLLSVFCHPSFVAIAFDSGGVATGTMSVTFILALVLGVASGSEGRGVTGEDLGMLALVALMPILSVLVLGLIYKPPWRHNKT